MAREVDPLERRLLKDAQARMSALFDGRPPMSGAHAEKPLREPVELDATVLMIRPQSVLISHDGREGWCPKALCRFDGLGPQRMKMERFKLVDLGFLLPRPTKDGRLL